MSELLTEANETVISFNEQRDVLTEIEALREEARQHLVESLATHMGERVLAQFCPNLVRYRGDSQARQVYDGSGRAHEPITEEVIIHHIERKRQLVTLGGGVFENNTYDHDYLVEIDQVLAITTLE